MATADLVRDGSQVVAGVANMYFAAVPTTGVAVTMPADTVAYGADPGTSWTPFGFSEDGVGLELNKDTDDVRASESLTPVNVLVTAVNAIVRISCLQDTIDNMKLAFGGGTLTTTVAATGVIGKKVFKLGTKLDIYSLFFEVETPDGFWQRVYVPKVLSVATVATEYKLNEVRVFPMEFRAICKPDEIVVTRKTANALP